MTQTAVKSFITCSLRWNYKHIGKVCYNPVNILKRYSNTVSNNIVEKHRHSRLGGSSREVPETDKPTAEARDYRFIFPEFLPNPEFVKRDKVSERLERRDMLNRRSVLHIPEFYVGSLLAVSVADRHASGKQSRFVGICIQRGGHGLRANFTLRNVVDGQGVEIIYDLYSPMVHKIEVLKLEKRLDDELLYLRDAPPEYSSFPFNIEPVSLPPNSSVPVNKTKVKLGPRPWSERWERKGLKGLEDLNLPQRFYDKAANPAVAKPWLKHDLMLKYRSSINDVEADEIMLEVGNQIKKTEQKANKMSAKKEK